MLSRLCPVVLTAVLSAALLGSPAALSQTPEAKDKPTGRVGAIWFNDTTVAWQIFRKPDRSFEGRGGDQTVTATGNRVVAKSGAYSGELTLERKEGQTVITGTWGSSVKHPVRIVYDAKSVQMKWGFYGRELTREDGPQTPAGCADYTRNDGGTRAVDRLQLCGDVLLENPPPAQTVISFLWTGFRRGPGTPSRPDYTIRENRPAVTNPQDVVKP